MPRALTEWNAQTILNETQQEVERRMFRALAMLEGKTKDLVSRGNRGGGNPSKPGEPPKVVTGTLRSNIGFEIQKSPNEVIGLLGVRMGPADKYAMRLELGFTGTDSLGRGYDQKERPYLRAALEQNKNQIQQILKGE